MASATRQPLRASSPVRPRSSHLGASSYGTPQKKLMASSTGFNSNAKTNYSASVSPNKSGYKSGFKSYYAEGEFVRSLNEQANIESDLEMKKNRVASQPDFNVFDAFKVIDTYNRGYVTKADLKYAL